MQEVFALNGQTEHLPKQDNNGLSNDKFQNNEAEKSTLVKILEEMTKI